MRIFAALTTAFLLAGCTSNSAQPPSTITVTASSPGKSTAASGPITLPDFTNQNAEIARKKLESLGLTNVKLTSANPKYTFVIQAANWTVVSMEPPAGTVVQPGDPVIVKVTKP
ncbi:PASTA domain-containing protein [Mycobacterium sp. Aquia_213]|uniref:PASTA domain-containing protein n=1 Tax=Mycobacterium sp. Aquia_213 TaxID=2991728 RepID=UPI00226FBA16|nr:PASTA domain-containing protein [Mycobacterium sp. Aquia_213]WAC89711.1 PASTA domain-containing protein [Mycobacterium sp. Aquia_213]